MTQPAPAIQLDAISLQRGSHQVLDNLTLTIDAGRWHCVLGRSGIGKSSLLRLLAGLDAPDSGTISLTDGGALDRRVAYLSQDDGLLPWLTVLDNVQLGPRLRGTAGEQSRRQALALLAQVDLAHWHAALPSSLSGGMRQRVALARTLLENRPVVLMDEPFSSLDAITRSDLQDLARELLDQRTVILVTHDPIEALRLAHGITVLQGGYPTRIVTLALDSMPPRRTESDAVREHLPTLWQALQLDADGGRPSAISPGISPDGNRVATAAGGAA